MIHALDIETTGLDANTCEVLAIGVTWGQHVSCFSRQTQKEGQWLRNIEKLMVQDFNTPDQIIVTWNGDEFDGPFLAKRFEINDVPTTLLVEETGQVGKYGNPIHRCWWNGVPWVDLVPAFRPIAAERGVKCSLKPTAREILGVEPIEIENIGEQITKLTDSELRAYCRSDCQITLALADWLMHHYLLGLRP